MGTKIYFRFKLELMSEDERLWIQQRCKPAKEQTIEELSEVRVTLEEYGRWPAFVYQFSNDDSIVLFYSPSTQGCNPRDLAKLLYGFIHKFRTKNIYYAFEWAAIDTEQPISAYSELGGGAFFITYEEIQELSTLVWMYEQQIKWKNKRHES